MKIAPGISPELALTSKAEMAGRGMVSRLASLRPGMSSKSVPILARMRKVGFGQRYLSRNGFLGMWDSLRGQKFIAKDKYGNTYWEFNDPGGVPPVKREVHYAETRLEEIEFADVPAEWRLWCRYARDTPPTEEEVEQGEIERAGILERAKVIEEEEDRQRSFKIATGRAVLQGERNPIQEIAARMGHPEQGKGFDAGSSGPFPGSGGGQSGEQSRGKPDTTGEPTGQGKSFKPGTWDPFS